MYSSSPLALKASVCGLVTDGPPRAFMRSRLAANSAKPGSSVKRARCAMSSPALPLKP